jgi:hypothetical protein
VNGKGEPTPSDIFDGYRHTATFWASFYLSRPGETLRLELVDRVGLPSESQDEQRILSIEGVAAELSIQAQLSMFVAVKQDGVKERARRVRLTLGKESVEVEVPRAHLPSHPCKRSDRLFNSPTLHAGEWSQLAFHAQSGDDRGLTIRMVDPPLLELDGRTHTYPDWPEPGWIWRVKVLPSD